MGRPCQGACFGPKAALSPELKQKEQGGACGGCPPSCLGLLYDHLCQLGAVPAAHLSHGCALQEIPAKDAPCQQPHSAVVAKDGVKGTGGEGNGGEKRGQRRRLLAPQTGIPIAAPSPAPARCPPAEVAQRGHLPGAGGLGGLCCGHPLPKGWRSGRRSSLWLLEKQELSFGYLERATPAFHGSPSPLAPGERFAGR